MGEGDGNKLEESNSLADAEGTGVKGGKNHGSKEGADCAMAEESAVNDGIGVVS